MSSPLLLNAVFLFQGAGGIGSLGSIGMMAAMFAVFYFLLIRPQQKRAQEHKNMIMAVRRADTVVTGGGLIGKVVKVVEGSDEVTIEIAPEVRVKVLRATIQDVRTKTASKPANNPVAAKKPAVKKTAAKKPVAKKTATKKPATKKPAAKKATPKKK